MKGRRTIRAWAVIFWLFLWQAGAMVINQRIILVSPLRVLARLAELAPTLEFWGAIGYSMVRITAGFLLGVAAGILLAALSARFRRVEELLAPALLAIKSIPVASFIIYHSGADPVLLPEPGGADLLPDRPAGAVYQHLRRYPGR